MRGTSRKAYTIILCTFVMGVVAGLAAGSLVWKRGQASPNRPNFVQELSTELDLSPEQRAEVEVILNESKQRFQELSRQVNPQFEEIRRQYRDKISALLSPDQKARFEEWKKRQDARREQHRRPDDKKH